MRVDFGDAKNMRGKHDQDQYNNGGRRPEFNYIHLVKYHGMVSRAIHQNVYRYSSRLNPFSFPAMHTFITEKKKKDPGSR